MRRILLFLVIANIAFASNAEKEQLVIGKWRAHTPRRADRIIIFHPDHTWGVTNVDPHNPEEINGRCWRLEGDKLILSYPDTLNGRDHLASHAYKILSFNRDKLATDAFTYARIK